MKKDVSRTAVNRVLDLTSAIMILYFICSTKAQNENSPGKMCLPFPHSHLFCGQYIDASTIVYIDPDSINYTEMNNVIEDANNRGMFGFNVVVGNSCSKQLPYMICQYVYPRCNSTTQTLQPVCKNNCLNYTEMCEDGFRNLSQMAISENNLLWQQLVFNCSDQFRMFSSVTVDPEECYHFYLAPVFLPTTDYNADDITILRIADPDTYSMFCSHVPPLITIPMSCKVNGIPIPNITIYREGVNGGKRAYPTTFRQEGEIVVGVPELRPKDFILLHCVASNIVSRVKITINLTYTCCSGDGEKYAIGEQFVVSDHGQCFCGDGGNITCHQLQTKRNTNNISTGLIVVISVIIILVIATILIIMFSVLWLVKKRHTKTLDISRRANLTANVNYDGTLTKGNNALFRIHDKDEGFKSSTTYSKIFSDLSDVEIPLERLCISAELGEGAFGTVYKGTITTYENDDNPILINVAIKTIKADILDSDELQNFLAECILMKKIEHPNVLDLLGISFNVEEGVPYVILPFMANGDLKTYLYNKRATTVPKYPEGLDYVTLLRMCCEIANGMKYLAEHKFIHRDLAARNCLVASDITIKIGDFGLARQLYSKDYYRLRHRAKVPIKWMALESIHDGIFNEKTDVWAFGITCWEIFTLGGAPYAALDFEDMLLFLEKGSRLRKPQLCSQIVYELLLQCWQFSPDSRPSFTVISQQLTTCLSPNEYVNIRTE